MQMEGKAEAGKPVGVKSYDNADVEKTEMFKENNGKSGVYQWINLINKKNLYRFSC